MKMSTPIVITVPTKYIPINLAPAPISHPMVKVEMHSSVSSIASDAEESTSSMEEFLVRGKKRRLDHLTWEEKLQRKKLKNRVAAQTSRDRKKAKMEDMELTIKQQSDQIHQLQSKCENLQLEKDAIYSKYLDLESRFEELQRQFDEQKKQQQQSAAFNPTAIKSEPEFDVTSRSVGCVSTLTGSAAGILQTGNTNDSGPGTSGVGNGHQRKDSLALEDHCSLPALQDMLEEFDVSKLEELAESLLANVTSELEDTDRGSSPADAEDASPSSRVSGPVVGTTSEQLEPSEESADTGSSLILTTHNYSKSPFHVEKIPVKQEQQSDVDQQQQQQQTMVFGTYDNATNCITIILNDDELPLEEEIICEEAEEVEVSDERQDFKMKLEPMRELLSPIPSTCSDYSSQPMVPLDDEVALKCPLTPGSFISDGGYESLGSPTGSSDYSIPTLDEFWNLDLFPILN